MFEWFEKLPLWAKIAIPVVAIGIIVLIWSPWKKSSSASSSSTSAATTTSATTTATGAVPAAANVVNVTSYQNRTITSIVTNNVTSVVTRNVTSVVTRNVTSVVNHTSVVTRNVTSIVNHTSVVYTPSIAASASSGGVSASVAGASAQPSAPTYQVVQPGTAISVPNSTGKYTVSKTVTVIPSGTVLGSANVGGGVPSGVSYRIIDVKKVAN